MNGQALPAQILVLAKAPVSGRAKTRLCPPYDPEQAASLARAALDDTVAVVTATPVQRRVLVVDEPALDVTPAGFQLLVQRGDGLDERIANALDDAWAGATLPMLLVGMDTPQLRSRLLLAALRRLIDGCDAVLGPAWDGGFWALGLRRPSATLVRGVPMSLPCTGDLVRDRLRGASLRLSLLPILRDVDTAADADAVAHACPDSRFARALRSLRATARNSAGSVA